MEHDQDYNLQTYTRIVDYGSSDFHYEQLIHNPEEPGGEFVAISRPVKALLEPEEICLRKQIEGDESK